MIHIVFNEADIAILQQAILLDDSLQGDVIQIKDDYAVGPLENIYVGEGIDARKKWWQEVLAGGDYAGLAESGDVDEVCHLSKAHSQSKVRSPLTLSVDQRSRSCCSTLDNPKACSYA